MLVGYCKFQDRESDVRFCLNAPCNELRGLATTVSLDPSPRAKTPAHQAYS